VLVGIEIFFRLTSVEFAGRADSAVGSVSGVGIDDVCSVGEENALALDGDVFRHAQRDRETFGSPDHRIGNACISAGGIQQSLAGGKLSAAAAFFHDVEGGAGFDRSARVEPLGLAEKLNLRQFAGDAL